MSTLCAKDNEKWGCNQWVNRGKAVLQPYSIMPMNSGKDYKARLTDVAQPLMAGGPVGGNQGGDYIAQPVAFVQNTRDEVRLMGGDGQIAGALASELGMKQQCYIAQPVAFDTTQITSKQNGSNPKPGDPCHPLAAGAHAPAIAFPSNANANAMGALGHNLSPTMQAQGAPPAVCYGIPGNWIGREPKNGGNAVEPMHGVAPCLNTTDRHGVAPVSMAVRRLTPVECERLMGMPDNYTRIPWRGKPAEECPDGPRYKALGNSMATNVMEWIGERIGRA